VFSRAVTKAGSPRQKIPYNINFDTCLGIFIVKVVLFLSSGGPRKVVLLLPDGNMMMTEVDEEQYAALELDK